MNAGGTPIFDSPIVWSSACKIEFQTTTRQFQIVLCNRISQRPIASRAGTHDEKN